MPFAISIPQLADNPIEVPLDVGDSLFLLGANGTGKSSLLFPIFTANQANAQRITAHRQTWFSTGTIELSAATRQTTGQNVRGFDTNAPSRWKDDYAKSRPSIALFDLVEAENRRARSIASAVDAENIVLAQQLSKENAPIGVISEILQSSNIPVKISVENNSLVASKAGSDPYSIAELSDGERNALLLASEVLTVAPGTLVIIDEPERHLHRSIISPLLTNLFGRRSDCAFIVSTHEVALPIDNPASKIVLVRNCSYVNNSPVAWDVDVLTEAREIDESLRRDILGGRRKVLYIEGHQTSLDEPLYSIVFPSISVIPKSGCREVINAVSGVRGEENLHWVKAFGIIDNDGRPDEEIDDFASKGIHALSVFSVESIYYHPDIQEKIAERQAAVSGADVNQMLDAARTAAIAAIANNIEHLAERTAERALRQLILSMLPKREDIRNGLPIETRIEVAECVTNEKIRINQLCEDNDVSGLLRLYPVRETQALGQIATSLGFQGRKQYEAAVRKLLLDDEVVLQSVRDFFGQLYPDIQAG